jgi:hypothetical protein
MSKPNQGPRPKSAGRKPSARKRSPRSGQAGVSLRRAIDKAVSQDCDKIARALVNQTIAGNMTGARLITALTDAEKSPTPKKKKRRGLTEAQRLALEPSWDDTPPEERKRILIARGRWDFEYDCPADERRSHIEDADLDDPNL